MQIMLVAFVSNFQMQKVLELDGREKRMKTRVVPKERIGGRVNPPDPHLSRAPAIEFSTLPGYFSNLVALMRWLPLAALTVAVVALVADASNYSRHPFENFSPGYDIGIVYLDVNGCITECDRIPTCLGFVYISQYNGCWLKYVLTGVYNTTNSDSYYKIASPTSYKVVENQQFSDATLLEVLYTHVDNCILTCDAKAACVGFQFIVN
ncbi:hypothetical protein HDU93_002849 [Gonapodya sp. JEL0774]|nr:hypothetical protein HDU93_002849 [Gonapodya sp. JEL0774]